MPRHFLIGETSDMPRGCPAIFSTKVPWFHRSHIIGARVWGRRRAISDIVDCESTSDYARSSKPAPDIFLKAVERVAPTTAHECVVILRGSREAHGLEGLARFAPSGAPLVRS